MGQKKKKIHIDEGNSSYLFLCESRDYNPLAFSGRGQRYSWSSTWWLLSPSCWSYWRKKSEEVYFYISDKNFKEPSWKREKIASEGTFCGEKLIL